MRTLPKAAAALASAGVLLLAVALGQQADRPSPAAAPMKFNDVREVAPGVFFRYSSISATDPSVPFGGCNNVWVVFKDYVAVIARPGWRPAWRTASRRSVPGRGGRGRSSRSAPCTRARRCL